MIPTVTTQRLVLRGPRIEDFEAYADLFASDRSRYMNGPKNRRQAWDEYASDCATWLLRGCGSWAIETRDGGTLAGWSGVVYPDYYCEPELGWVLIEEFEGRGFAYEAAQAARTYASEHFGLDRMVSFISVGNRRSIRLAERLGATLEETRGKPDDRFHVFRHPAPEARQ